MLGSRSVLFLIAGSSAFAVAVAACGANNPTNTTSSASSGSGGAGATTTSSSGSGAGDIGGNFNPTSTGGGGTTLCDHLPDEDGDNDGFTGAQGDCNDCDPNVNPGAVEVIVTEPVGDGGVPAPADEDCDGKIDNPPLPCDGNLILADTSPNNGARAMELCQTTTMASPKWGVLDAKYVGANGGPRIPGYQVGLLSSYGTNVNTQAGKRMLALSTGRARTPGQNGACDSQSCSNNTDGPAPPGYPQNIANCPPKPDIHDDIALELTLKAPKNATGYQFNFKMASFEFPEWVCTFYNDQFIALVTPPPMGSLNGNISFDNMNNPVSVNLAFFDVCDPNKGVFAANCPSNCPMQPSPYCPLGPADLAGTGMAGNAGDLGDGGQTAWLVTQAPIGGGEVFTIRFAIWDTGDHNLDSTVLIDGFSWIASGGTVAVGTKPIDTPK